MNYSLCKVYIEYESVLFREVLFLKSASREGKTEPHYELVVQGGIPPQSQIYLTSVCIFVKL